jgi:cellulose synthase/poly-beta-1,6-N-acetylglucosamine synthase-like glycosyltransferase
VRQAALTISSKTIKAILKWNPEAVEVPISNEQQIQIVPEVNDLLRARRHQYAAFVASEAILVVWDDDKLHLLERASAIEEELIRFLWNAGKDETEKQEDIILSDCEVGEESGAMKSEERPIHYYHSVLVACTICLVTVLQSLGYQNIALDVIRLQRWESLAFLTMTPISIFLSLVRFTNLCRTRMSKVEYVLTSQQFFASVCIGVIAQVAGPITCLYTNSKFYSATPPPRLYNKAVPLPHVTIQCPVYKEGLTSVIIPTIKSIKKAVSTYELQGGSANIFINDDGLQIIPEEDRQARIQFYEDYGIGWTARPGHGQDGFQRKGKFKKASNMNYGLSISNQVEERLHRIDRPYDWSQADEVVAYERCLLEVLAEGVNKAWADGNIRIGDYILLIDSDTRVPEDCLLDAVSEMERSPCVAIIQFSSGVMQVAHNFFENGITFFTNLIYSAIRFGVSSGDVAPFVGHNAILRWSAIQQVAFRDKDDGKEKFWSESHVSEDFDMALRLQVQGYVIRFAAWAGDGFKEGVSLTVYDELTRWEKYAYGCNELVFNPIRTWLWRGGPFTPLFRRFITSAMPVGSKINIIAYIGTYYAIGASWVFILANYIAVGLYNGYLDKWYVESWRVWLAVTVVFSGAANVALAVQRYRLDQRTLIGACKPFPNSSPYCVK